jgi:glycerophosphoryl diester phosphodiesterase
MTILEQNLVPKNPGKKSEDGIVITNDFVAVIDGSTSKSKYRHSLLRSNGRYAMQLTERFIRRMPKTTTCEQFLTGVTAYIR